jgi:hypothetical protein
MSKINFIIKYITYQNSDEKVIILFYHLVKSELKAPLVGE